MKSKSKALEGWDSAYLCSHHDCPKKSHASSISTLPFGWHIGMSSKGFNGTLFCPNHNNGPVNGEELITPKELRARLKKA